MDEYIIFWQTKENFTEANSSCNGRMLTMKTTRKIAYVTKIFSDNGVNGKTSLSFKTTCCNLSLPRSYFCNARVRENLSQIFLRRLTTTAQILRCRRTQNIYFLREANESGCISVITCVPRCVAYIST